MTHVGIDFDTHAVHLVALEETGAAIYTRCELQGHDAFERLRSVRGALPRSSFWDDVIAVGIEEPQGAQKATVAKLKAVQGAIVACIPRATLVEPMVPARWRAVVGLAGNASKEIVAKFAARDLSVKWDADYNEAMRMRDWQTCEYLIEERKLVGWGDQDRADAYCLALAVSRLVTTEAVA